MKRSSSAPAAPAGVGGDVSVIRNALLTLHGTADPPRDLEVRQVSGTSLWQLRAFHYAEHITEQDFRALSEAIESCRTLCCITGHRVFFSMAQQSSQSELRGALIVELNVPQLQDDDDDGDSAPHVKRARWRATDDND